MSSLSATGAAAAGFAATALLLGCRLTPTSPPPGYAELLDCERELARVTSRRLRPQYVLADGRLVETAYRRGTVGEELVRGHIKLDHPSHVYQLTLGDRTLECMTRPRGLGVRTSRFGCWDPAGAVVLWVSPNENIEPCGPPAMLGAPFVPECWAGALKIADHTYTFAFASNEGRVGEYAVGVVSWSDADGRPLQLFNYREFVAERGRNHMQYRRSLPAQLPPGVEDWLLLSGFALYHWWAEIS